MRRLARRRWRRTKVRVLSAVLPATETVPGIDPERCVEFLARYRREAPFLPRLALNLSALVFLLTPPLTGAGMRSALALSPSRLERHCEGLSRHRSYHLRQVTLMLKTAAGMVWGADPLVREALGLAPYAEDPSDWREA
jgi:hypothetical protein